MDILLIGILVLSLLIAFTSSQSAAVPSWIVRPQNRTEKLHHNVSLSCSVDNAAGRWLAWMKIGSDGATSILFTNNDQRFQAPPRYFVASNGNGDSTLYLTLIEKDDDAQFQCDLQNSNLSAAAQVTVLVNPGVPLIGRNVSEDNLVENEFLQLSCESFGGNPPPIIKWFRNGVQLQEVVVVPPPAKFGKASAIVVWLLSRADFGANFTCTAEIKDVPNSLVSNGTVLQVKYAPVISLGPFSPRLTVLENSTLRINCNITAYPEVNQSTVQWFKDGQYIGNGASYVNSFISISDAGIYTCSARNFETRMANITVDVQYPPKPPPFQTFRAVEGSPLNLTIDFDANPPVNFTSMKWYNGTALVTLGRFLSKLSASRTDAGNYTVEARNSLSPSNGTSSLGLGKASLQLKVSYKPGQSTVVIPSSVVVGQTVEITCMVDDLGDPVGELIWYKVSKNETNPRGNIFRIVDAQPSDIGNYSCIAQNEVGFGLQDTKFLDISEPAKWVQSSLQNKSEVLVNRTLSGIQCIAQGHPAPLINWFKDGRPVDLDWFQVVTESQSSSKGFRWNTTSTLKWEGASRKPSSNSLRPDDAGIYSCRASVSTIENQTINQTTEIIILYPPLMSSDVVLVGVDPGASSRVTCSALGFPIPEYRWLDGDAAIGVDNGKYTIVNSKNGSVLTITNMTSQDVGVYICQATNAIGSSVMTFNLTLNSVPSQPTQLKILSITWESVELGWVPGFDGGIPQQFLIFFHLETAPVEVGSSFRFNLTGLFPNTTYVISVRSRNRLGISATSNVLTQTTDAFVVPAPENVKYHRDSKSVTCTLQFTHLDDYCIRLLFNTSDNFQQNYSECDLRSNAEVRLDSVLAGTEPRSIGVSLCLKRRLDVCSDTRNAEFVNSDDLPVRMIIIVCCVCGGFLLILLIILIAVCCCIRRKYKPYPDEQRTINAYESNVTKTGKDEKDVDNSPSFYAEGIDNLMLYQQELPPILYGKKDPYLDLYALDRSDSQGGGSDSGVSVSEVPKTKRIIHEVIV